MSAEIRSISTPPNSENGGQKNRALEIQKGQKGEKKGESRSKNKERRQKE